MLSANTPSDQPKNLTSGHLVYLSEILGHRARWQHRTAETCRNVRKMSGSSVTAIRIAKARRAGFGTVLGFRDLLDNNYQRYEYDVCRSLGVMHPRFGDDMPTNFWACNNLPQIKTRLRHYVCLGWPIKDRRFGMFWNQGFPCYILHISGGLL